MNGEGFAKELRERMLSQFLDIIILLFLNKPGNVKYPDRIKRLCETTLGFKISHYSFYCILFMLEKRA